VLGARFESQSRMRVNLARATSLDETAELANKHYVRVTDGDFRGAVYTADGFTVTPPTAASPTPIVVTPTLPRAGYVVARASTKRALLASEVAYSATDGGTIELSQQRVGPIGLAANLFDDVVLGQGDLVVIRDGVVDANGGVYPASPGIYSVSDAGDSSKTWKLTRYQGIDENGDGAAEPVYVGLVAINEGSQRTALTGEMLEVSYEALHSAPLEYRALGDFRQRIDLQNPASTPFDAESEYRFDVGSENPYGLVSFVTSTDQGTNLGAGSLGKMLGLVQSNTAVVSRVNVPQAFAARIAPGIQRIVLEQGLPAIEMPLEIDGDGRLSIDGSQIAYTRDGALVRNNSIVAANVGPVRASGEQASRKLVRTAGRASLTEVHGLEVQPRGAGTSITDVSLGGFRNGSAVQVNGAGNVLIDNVLIGQDRQGNRTPNQFGVFINGTAGSNAAYTTVHQSEIYSSEDAGIVVSGDADDVRIVGNAIGRNAAGNLVGIDVRDGEGLVRIGAAPIAPAAPIVGLPLTVVAANQFSVGQNSASDILQVGHQFYDRATNRLWQVTSVAPAAGGVGYTIGVSGPSLASSIGATVSVEAGYFVDAVPRSETLRLPENFPVGGLYLGQTVTGSVAGIFSAGTRIQAIRALAGGGTEIDLTAPVASGGRVAVLFGTGARNAVSHNNDGVVLGAKDTAIVQTDIAFSVFDGLVVNDVRAGGGHVIGGVDGTVLSRSNAAINANGLAGIRFSDAFFAGLVGLTEKLAKAGQVSIRGNFLGTDSTASATGLANGIDGASNIVFADAGVQQELVQRTTRGADGRYLAQYRPEDDRTDPDLADVIDRDRAGNFHFTGDPVIVAPGTGGGFTGGGTGSGGDDDWMIDPPIRR
jgi:hypothetical protein